MFPRSSKIVCFFLLAVFLVSACGGGPATTAPAPLRVGWSLWPGFYPIAIAAEKGFFDKQGVQVEPVFYSVYNDQASDLASGMIDGGAAVLSDILFDSISSNVKVVLITDNSTGADQIVAADSIPSLQEVRGKRIGVQPGMVGGMLLIRQMLEQNGIQPSEVTFVDVPPEKVPSAIPGLIDLGYTFEPFASEALAKGHKALFTSADAPGVIVNVLAFRTQIAQSRPQDVKAFIAAWEEALQYWKDHPAEGNAIIAAATGLKPEAISTRGVTLFDLTDNRAAFVSSNDAASIYFTARKELQFLADNGDITRPVDINTLLDPSFLQ